VTLDLIIQVESFWHRGIAVAVWLAGCEGLTRHYPHRRWESPCNAPPRKTAQASSLHKNLNSQDIDISQLQHHASFVIGGTMDSYETKQKRLKNTFLVKIEKYIEGVHAARYKIQQDRQSFLGRCRLFCDYDFVKHYYL